MKKVVVAMLILSIGLTSPAAYACTSFAVYTDAGPIYGMNFDNQDRDYRLRYDHVEDLKEVYSVHFLWSGANANTPMMNEDGFFTAIQAHEPYEMGIAKFIEGEETLSNLAIWTPHVFDRVEAIREIAGQTPIHHMYGSFHDLFADATGDAMVLEVIGGETRMTDIEGDYIIMTNFPNAYLKDTETSELQSIPFGGMDRYEIVDAYIREHLEHFSFEEGLSALEAARNENYFSPTVYSMVFDPTNKAIFMTVKGDFDHVWKVDMESHTVETFRGFEKPLKIEINDKGVSLRALYAYANGWEEEYNDSY